MFWRKGITKVTARKVFLQEGVESLEVRVESGKKFGSFVVTREIDEPDFLECERAVKIVRTRINLNLVGKDPLDLSQIDNTLKFLDGTDRFRKIGKNVSFGVSIANLILASRMKNVPVFRYVSEYFGRKERVPKTFVTIVEGQRYGHFPIREIFLISEIWRIKDVLEIFREFKKEIRRKFGSSYIFPGLLGGFSINFKDPLDTMLTISKILEDFEDISLGIDFNAEKYYFDKVYDFSSKMGREEYIDYVREFLKTFKEIKVIIDPFSREDFREIVEIKKVRNDVEVFTRNIDILGRADGLVVFPEMFGTITDLERRTKEIKVALFDNTYSTCDTTIVDISVGLGFDYMRIGGMLSYNRVKKVERLLEIGESFKSKG